MESKCMITLPIFYRTVLNDGKEVGQCTSQHPLVTISHFCRSNILTHRSQAWRRSNQLDDHGNMYETVLHLSHEALHLSERKCGVSCLNTANLSRPKF